MKREINKMAATLREEIFAGRSSNLTYFGGIYFGGSKNYLFLAEIYFGVCPE